MEAFNDCSLQILGGKYYIYLHPVHRGDNALVWFTVLLTQTVLSTSSCCLRLHIVLFSSCFLLIVELHIVMLAFFRK